MNLSDIQCSACRLIGYYVYTTDYLGTGASGYYCQVCYAYYTEQEFANKHPDYDQSNDHNIPVIYPS